MRVFFDYIDTNGHLIERQVGELGNWSMIPSLAVSVHVVAQSDGEVQWTSKETE